MKILKHIVKIFLVYGGVCNLHGTAIQKYLRSFLNQIDLEYFRKTHRSQKMESRDKLFTFIHEHIGWNIPITYMEFGVHKGDSMTKWLCQNSNSESRFYGFDSFEGLPERWDKERGKGLFDVGGQLPEIGDPRVVFVKGWFDDTLPKFVKDFDRAHDSVGHIGKAPLMNQESLSKKMRPPLVIHLDADLYSSTILALIYLNPFIVRGTVLIFDEFYDRDHEFKAFVDFCEIFKKEFKVLCEMSNFAKVGIEIS